MNLHCESSAQNGAIDMQDHATFDRVFRLFHAVMCVFSQKIVGSTSEAEDVVEEVFFKLWDKKAIFDNENHVRFFLYRAVRNESLNYLKAQQRSSAKHLSAEIETISPDNHLQAMISSEVLLMIYNEISLLPPQEKKVITLNLLDEKSLQEVADELGLSLQSIKNYKTRALAKLRLRLPKDTYLILLVLFTF